MTAPSDDDRQGRSDEPASAPLPANTDGSVVSAPDWGSVDPQVALTLVVGWNSAGNKVKLRKVRTHEDIARVLSDIVAASLGNLAEREPQPWAPDAIVEPETYLVLPAAQVGGFPEVSRDIKDRGALLDALRTGAGLPVQGGECLPAAEMSLYAFVVGDDPGHRAVFLRRANPRRSLHRGRRVFGTLGDVLTRVEQPLFGFDAEIDLVYIDDTVVVLSQTAFAALFRANATLAAQVPQWVGQLKNHLPFAPGAEEQLQAKAMRDSRIRRRLEAITRRGHLQSVTASQIRQVLSDHGMRPAEYLTLADELQFTADNTAELLHVLNEDLFTGPFSNANFRADRKQQVL